VTRPPDDGKLIHIRDILSSALEKYRPAGDTDMTKPRAFRDGVLIVHVPSSSWIHQLKFLEKQVAANINSHLDQQLVRQIRFKIGSIHG
jgi:predicted nucleic acid-binding Zn ribbon protein